MISDIANMISSWFSSLTNGLHFFNGALRILTNGISSLFQVFADFPAFLVAFLGLGCFLIFANVILKII